MGLKNTQWPGTKTIGPTEQIMIVTKVCPGVLLDFRLSSCHEFSSWKLREGTRGDCFLPWKSGLQADKRTSENSFILCFQRDREMRGRRRRKVWETTSLLQFITSKGHILGYQFLSPNRGKHKASSLKQAFQHPTALLFSKSTIKYIFSTKLCKRSS